MARSRLGMLGLCAMMLSLLAFGAGTAHAEEKSLWLVLDSNGVLKTKLEAVIGLEAETVQVMHTKVLGVSVLFECKTVEGVGAMITSEGKITGAKVKYGACITKLNGVVSAACEPVAGGTEKGVIKSNATHALIELHELVGGVKDDILKILPDTGEVFVVIELGEECSIGSKIPVLGRLTAKDCENLSLTHLVKHLTEAGPLSELWVISKTAEHSITMLGSTWVFLTGAHKGLKFAGDPA